MYPISFQFFNLTMKIFSIICVTVRIDQQDSIALGAPRSRGGVNPEPSNSLVSRWLWKCLYKSAEAWRKEQINREAGRAKAQGLALWENCKGLLRLSNSSLWRSER